MNHFISLGQAIQMTTLYRKEKENILADPYKGLNILSNSETFDAAPFLTLLGKPECKSLRIYFGMGDDLKIHAIIVAVNANNEDILPLIASGSGAPASSLDDPGDIVEEGISCPPACPPPSPLNP